MKKLSIIMLIVMFASIFICIGVGFSATRSYNGFTIYYDAEKNKGIVYLNCKSTSVLLVSYPSLNETYYYGVEGQQLLNTQVLQEVMRDPSSGVVKSIVGVISPVNGTL